MTKTALPRGQKRRDFYATPAWATWAISSAVARVAGANATLVDPFAGDGAILAVLAKAAPWLPRYGIEIDAARARTARSRRHNVITGDAFSTRWKPHSWHAVVVTNPPYSQAEECIRACVDRASSVFALLPLSFLGSAERKGFFRAVGVPDLHVLDRRPSFCITSTCFSCKHVMRTNPKKPAPLLCKGCGSSSLRRTTSDAQVYAWFYWRGPYSLDAPKVGALYRYEIDASAVRETDDPRTTPERLRKIWTRA